MLQAFVPNVLAISDGCCTCFICVLHMFHTYVASVSSGCCICFTHMLQEYVRNVSVVLVLCCNKCFHVVSYKCFYLDVAYVFTYMLQVFYLHITYVCNGFKVFFMCF